MNTGEARTPRNHVEGEAQAEQRAQPVRVRVSAILGGGREAILEYDGQEYRLRITANGKLILTK